MKKVVLILLIIFSISSVSVVALSLCNAKDIEYNASDTNWDVDTVEDALNDLYQNNSCDVTDDVLDYLRQISKTYEYTEEPEEFIAPISGIYKLEVWGAQGGSYNTSKCIGGKGGYSYGNIKLNKGDKLYIVVGGAGIGGGAHVARAGGYNGGGNAVSSSDGNTRQSSGGGATHIATESGLLLELSEKRDSIIIVAGGGGGGGGNSKTMCVAGGDGGGETGSDGGRYTENGKYRFGLGGTQESHGGYDYNGEINVSITGGFGQGSEAVSAGGGGGYYGGGVGTGCYSGGGGSGYLNRDRLLPDTADMVNGDHEGDGFAQITFVSLN